jgi:uncharacterized surface protein with fasciclin (FAS1) repeats
LEYHVMTGNQNNLTSTKLRAMRGQNVTFLNNKTLQIDVTSLADDEEIKEGNVIMQVRQHQVDDVIQLTDGGKTGGAVIVTQPDAVYASNGMGHVINRVLGIISLVDLMEEMATSGALPVSLTSKLPVSLESILENVTAVVGTEIDPAMVNAQLDNAALTFFAPAKAAFLIFGFANPDFASVMKEPGWYVHTASLLAKHVTQDGGVLMQEDFVSGGLEVKMLNQETVYIEADTANPDDAAGTFAIYPTMDDMSTSLAKVENADILAYEGVVHMIDRVLLPAFMELTVMDVIRRENPTLAVLFEKVPDLVTYLDEEAFGVTVFLPTTEALATTIDMTMMEHLQSPDEHSAEMLATILNYHIVAYNVPTTSMENEMTLKTGFNHDDDEEVDANNSAAVANTLTVQRNGRAIVIAGSSSNGGITSTIVQENRLARNGLVHLIDTVLLPASLPTMPQFPATGSGQPGGNSGDNNGVVTNAGGASGATTVGRSLWIVAGATIVATAMSSSIVWAL